MTTLNANILYKNHTALINSLCNKWSLTTGIDYSDLKSIANEAFARAFNTFNPEKHGTKFITYLQFLIVNDFKTAINKASYRYECQPCEEIDNDVLFTDYGKQQNEIEFKTMLSQLSWEAKQVCKILFNAPEEIRETLTSRTTDYSYKKKLIPVIMKELDINKSILEEIFAEIKSILN